MTSFVSVGQAYGYNIYSEVNIPGLPMEVSGNALGDMFIRRGNVPVNLPQGQRCGAFCEGSQDEFLLRIPDVAAYHITPAGITVSPVQHADAASVQLFLLGSALGAFLHIRGTLALHASAVRASDGTALAFCGVSTAGKSTLAAALRLQGYEAVADDIVAIHFDQDNVPWVYPGVAQAKLWGSTLSLLGVSASSGEAERIRPGMDKYYVSLAVHTKPLRLSRLYELSSTGLGETVIEPIKGKGRIETLVTHIFRPGYLKALRRDVSHMHQLMRLAPGIKMSRITRPQSTNTIDTIVDMLRQDWR